jgi:hypothetical protein
MDIFWKILAKHGKNAIIAKTAPPKILGIVIFGILDPKSELMSDIVM